MLVLYANTGNLAYFVGLLPVTLNVQLRYVGSAATERNSTARKTDDHCN